MAQEAETQLQSDFETLGLKLPSSMCHILFHTGTSRKEVYRTLWGSLMYVCKLSIGGKRTLVYPEEIRDAARKRFADPDDAKAYDRQYKDQNVVWHIHHEGDPVPGPVLLHSKQFHVHWKYKVPDSSAEYFMFLFRVFFSFHVISSTPQQLLRGMWNCSSSIYSDFELHLLCNLKTECDGGRDEEDCLHTPCAHDGVVVAGRCYFLSPSEAVFGSSSNDAEKRCASHGTQLAALNTPETWKQCIDFDKLCDGFGDCLDITDEGLCQIEFFVRDSKVVPAMITLNGRGRFTVIRLADWTTPCPDTHFKCLSIEFCLPVYLRCNGVNDCPEKEDEKGCDDSRSCPGVYRCRGFMNTFLHPDNLCDGWSQCSQHDDELFCNLTCPAQCSCLGHSWFCQDIFQANMYPLIRFLHAANSGMTPSVLSKNVFLIHLSLSNCGVVDIENSTLPNLHSLDLAGNRIRVLTENDLNGLPNLNTLFLNGNPLNSMFIARMKLTPVLHKLVRLDLSDVKIRSLNSSLLATFPNLQTLNLSGCGVVRIPKAAFQMVPKLRVLDMRRCHIVSLFTGVLKSLTRLRTVRADDFKVCCPVILPDNFHSNECDSPGDSITSCNDLFKSNLLRVSWSIATSMAFVCNVAIIFKRLDSMYSRKKSAMNLFITSLFVCGCIHTFYMAIIGLADASYRGNYLRKDIAWKHGPLCTFAGFLWLLSMEMSLFLVGLVTLDRVLISWLPSTPLRFSRKSAVVVICVVVMGCSLIALIPLPSRWKLFQQTAICSPLLLSGHDFQSDQYLFGVVSVFNVSVSWLVGLGQLSVYAHLHRKRFAFVQSPNQTKELSISRRVMAVVLCDAVHWLVTGHFIHFVNSGMTVSDEVVVLAQVLVMPLNWTLKPSMHAVATLLEHRRRDREERMLKILIAKRQN